VRVEELQQQAGLKGAQLKALIDCQCRSMLDSLCMWETSLHQGAAS
jgi:hypothetical protein